MVSTPACGGPKRTQAQSMDPPSLLLLPPPPWRRVKVWPMGVVECVCSHAADNQCCALVNA
eukprot:9502564-Pyramimonas_sp.AAC.1